MGVFKPKGRPRGPSGKGKIFGTKTPVLPIFAGLVLQLPVRGPWDLQKYRFLKTSLVTNLVSFLRDSPKRMQWFRDIALEHEDEGGCANLPSLCATRWSMRARALAGICCNYRALLEFFNDVDNTDTTDIGVIARGHATKLLQFDTFFCIELMSPGFLR